MEYVSHFRESDSAQPRSRSVNPPFQRYSVYAKPDRGHALHRGPWPTRVVQVASMETLGRSGWLPLPSLAAVVCARAPHGVEVIHARAEASPNWHHTPQAAP